MALQNKCQNLTTSSASLHLIDTDMLIARLAEAENTVLPSLEHTVALDPTKIVNAPFPNASTVIAMLPLTECLKFPGITDGRLFAKNVRQSLGSNNKVNRALKRTIYGERVDFMFYHNGITAICDFHDYERGSRSRLMLKGVSVVNGCQSLLKHDLHLLGAGPRSRSQGRSHSVPILRDQGSSVR